MPRKTKTSARRPQTIAEKIFSLHSGKPVYSGDFVIADLDLVMAHDTTCAWAIDPFYQIADRVWDRTKIFIPFDHAFPAPNVQMAKLQSKIRAFAKEQDIPINTDGVCHQIMSESLVHPGDLVLGADSHSPTSGGVGAITIGVGSTDAAIAMATGKSWFRVPRTIRININGTLQPGVFAKDIILMVAKTLGTEGGNYHVLEYGGETVRNLPVTSRLTLTNMSAEMGAEAAIVEPDDHTRAYLQAHGRIAHFDEADLWSDEDAEYAQVLTFDVSDLSPQIARPPDIDRVVPVTDVQDDRVAVDQVFIGSCTNCRIEDLDVVYQMWQGQKLNPNVRTIITPASKRVMLQAIAKGYPEFFIKLGAHILTPGCGPCLGRHGGVLYDDEVCVSTSNRNFTGRMGSPKAKIYLASPATAAASAITGFITDPRQFIHL